MYLTKGSSKSRRPSDFNNMIAAAVNCLLTEASWKIVPAFTGSFFIGSAYPTDLV
jgi:hypothetical protein